MVGRLRPVAFDLWLPRGPDLSVEVLSLRGTEALSQPYEFEIEVWCDDPDAELEQALGADCELLLERNGLERAIFGVIAELEILLAAELRIEREGIGARFHLVPAFRLLEHEVATRFFAGQTVIEILGSLLGERLSASERTIDVESRITGKYAPRDYCVQFRESTFDFCNRIMEEEGIAYFFVPDHDEQRERMVLVDGSERHGPVELLVPGPIAVERDRPDQLDRESLQALHWRHRVASNRVVTRGHNYKLGNPVDEGDAMDLGEVRPIARTRFHDALQRQIIDDPVGDPEALAFDGSGIEQQAVLAQRVLEGQRVDTAIGRGRGNAIGFTAGSVFELEQALAGGPKAREFLLTRVVHVGRRVENGDESSGCFYDNQFECMLRGQAYRPPRRTPKPRVHGVQTGVVVGKQPDEVHTDRLGRVQVVFPLHDHDPSQPPVSCWIRVAQVWAGQGFGAMVIPRVGMEVVVSFVDGDPDCPLITGCVYSGINLPPYELPSQLSKSTFKTSSTPGGEEFSELRIEDAKGSEQVFVRAQRRMDLRVQGTLFATCTGGREEIVGSPHDGPEEYATVDVRLAWGDVHALIKQHQLVEAIGDVCHAGHADVLEANRGNRMTWTDIEHQVTAPKIISEASDTISQKANRITLAGSDTISLMGGAKLVFESNNALELRVGQSFISLHQGGVDIDGPMIRIKSGGGVGHADDASSASPFELPLPLEALPADDGRIRASGLGGGGRSRTRGTWSLAPHSAPPMTPAKPKRPDPGTPHEAIGTWLNMAWKQSEVWCSEPVGLGFIVVGVPTGGYEVAFVCDGSDGSVVAGVGFQSSGNLFDVPVVLREIVPRALPDGVESSRNLNARLENGLSTSVPIALRFLTTLPSFTYRKDDGTRFSIRVQDHTVEIATQIRYIRGMMGFIISLGDLVDADTEGLIDQNIDGTTDWRYCKAMSLDELVYWDGDAWQPVPKEFGDTNALGNKLSGIGLWREGKKIRTQYGNTAWPDDHLPDWHESSIEFFQKTLPKWTVAIDDFWSGKCDLHRDQCQAHEPRCCRHSIVCKVGFCEVDAHTEGVVVIGENEARANSEAWSLSASNRTVIHEFGHHLGNPDEYPGASTVDITVNGDGALLGIDEASIMGSGMLHRRRHFDTIAEALAELVVRETSKAFTFTPVDVLP